MRKESAVLKGTATTDGNVFYIPPRIEALQVMRFFAAATVSLYHFSLIDKGITQNTIYRVLFFVQLFFFISGFLVIFTTKDIEKRKNFVVRRLIRLVPLYWLLTIGTFAVAQIIPQVIGYTPGGGELIKSMCFIPYARGSLKSGMTLRPIVGLGHTLQMEIVFSLVFAICMKLSHKHRAAFAVTVASVLAIVGKLVTFQNPVLKFYITDNAHSWISFAGGMLSCILLMHIEKKKVRIEKLSSVFIPAAVAVVLVLLAQLFFEQIAEYGLIDLVSVAIFFAVMVFLITYSLRKLPIPGFFVALGNMSFSYYLIHYYVVSVGERVLGISSFGIKNIVFIVMILVASWIAAFVSWNIIEKRLGNFLLSKLKK